MDTILKRLGDSPIGGIFSLLMVWFGLALGHTQVVLQHSSLPMGLLDTSLSWILGFGGFALVWIGLKRPEEQATILGYIGGSLIWCGFFEWTWRYFGHWLGIEPIMDQGMMILSPELLMIQATTLIVLSMLIFLGANKRQHARTAAIETVFLVWTIYLFAIFINDPRGIKYDSILAMVLTGGFVVWGIYLVNKLLKIRGLGPAFRYAIPTGSICWLPIEAFARWGLYPEIWVMPKEYTGLMSVVLILFVAGVVGMYKTEQDQVVEATA
jgi:hypothetical protein